MTAPQAIGLILLGFGAVMMIRGFLYGLELFRPKPRRRAPTLIVPAREGLAMIVTLAFGVWLIGSIAFGLWLAWLWREPGRRRVARRLKALQSLQPHRPPWAKHRPRLSHGARP